MENGSFGLKKGTGGVMVNLVAVTIQSVRSMNKATTLNASYLDTPPPG